MQGKQHTRGATTGQGNLVSGEAKFAALLESAPDAIVIVDHGGRINIVNTQAERLFGYTRHEMIGQPVEMLLPETIRAMHRRHRDAYIQEPRTRPMGLGLDLVGRRKDGSRFPTEISLSPLDTGEEMLVTAVVRDITERKRAADELERQVQRRTAHLNTLREFSEELLRARGVDAVLKRALDHAMVLDPGARRGAIYLHEPAGNELKLRASTGFEQMPPASIAADLGITGIAFSTRQAQITESVEELEQLLHRGTGPERREAMNFLELPNTPTGLVAMPLLSHEQAIGVLLLLRDAQVGPFMPDARATLEGLANLTAAVVLEERSQDRAAALSSQLADLEEEQRKMAERLNAAEASMLQAARLSAVGQLAASVAHEINNPLYAARNSLYLLEEDLSPEARESPFLQMARDQLARIARIIERMRDFYRPPRGEMAAYDLNHLLEETLALASLNQRESSIRIVFAPAQDLPRVLCNGDQLRQVFLNLVLNALDAMPDGGTLSVRTEAQAHVVVVEVDDTGIGIPEEIHGRLFEPFFTNKTTGTGLGLSISAHIVTQHGGKIEVDSEEGKGSTFRVLLPYRPRA